MPITAEQLADINASVLETYINKGTVFKQNVSNKPMLDAFNGVAGQFVGGKDFVTYNVSAGQGGGSLQGYSGDDQVGYYNPTGIKTARAAWKEHHIGTVIDHTTLKKDGIDVVEGGSGEETTSQMSGREKQALANILDEKIEMLGEDYAFSLDRLIHGDGSSDTKAIAGIASIILDDPTAGSTFGVSRSNTWWRNRAATAAFASAGGQGAITSSSTGGGALITFMDKEVRERSRYAVGSTNLRYFCGKDFVDAYKAELRANGYYTQSGWGGKTPDGAMKDPMHAGLPLEWDPTLDDLSLSKRCYALDMGKRGIRLLYMNGQRMKKHSPDRPYDRYVLYNGITMTGVMIARQLNTQGVYDIA